MSGGDQVESVPLVEADTPNEDKPDVYFIVRHDAVHVFIKHSTALCCVNSKTDAVRLEALLFGSLARWEDNLETEVRLRLYVYNGQCLIEGFRKEVIDKEKGSGRDCWDHKPIIVERESSGDQIRASIDLLGKEEHWEIVKRTNQENLFCNPPQKLRVIEDAQWGNVLGEWVLRKTSKSEKRFMCSADIHLVLYDGNYSRNCGTLYARKNLNDPTLSQQADDTRDTSRGIVCLLEESLTIDDAYNLARNMSMSEADLSHFKHNYGKNAKECVHQLITSLQSTHGQDLEKELLPALLSIGRRDLKEKAESFRHSPFEGTRKRDATPCSSESKCKKLKTT